ncbi:MAG: ABC transporter substrate-binding protein [Desulfobacterales bacterium]|nr:ABC transporter substrate-binding protein [Desulfobacterales bacterium]MDJ0912712.1 ABC transporter substrate-binding protein [Desulfobacterales bacterium]
MRRFLPLMVVFLIGWNQPALGAEPEDTIKTAVEETLSIMKNPKYQGEENRAQLQEAVWKQIQAVFDYPAISQGALAINWRKFTPAQRREFTHIFAKLLKITYLKQIKAEYHDVQIEYLGQDMITEKRAIVKTSLKRKDAEVPIDYKMRLSKGEWRIYDINVEGVGLIKNYRAQFQQILKSHDPSQLIAQLKRKVDLFEKHQMATAYNK